LIRTDKAVIWLHLRTRTIICFIPIAIEDFNNNNTTNNIQRANNTGGIRITAVEALSDRILLLGCSDGCLRLYDVMMKNGGTGVNDASNSSTQEATNGCVILTVRSTMPTSDAPIKAIIGAASNRNNINVATDSSADGGCENEIEEEDGVDIMDGYYNEYGSTARVITVQGGMAHVWNFTLWSTTSSAGTVSSYIDDDDDDDDYDDHNVISTVQVHATIAGVIDCPPSVEAGIGEDRNINLTGMEYNADRDCFCCPLRTRGSSSSGGSGGAPTAGPGTGVGSGNNNKSTFLMMWDLSGVTMPKARRQRRQSHINTGPASTTKDNNNNNGSMVETITIPLTSPTLTPYCAILLNPILSSSSRAFPQSNSGTTGGGGVVSGAMSSASSIMGGAAAIGSSSSSSTAQLSLLFVPTFSHPSYGGGNLHSMLYVPSMSSNKHSSTTSSGTTVCVYVSSLGKGGDDDNTAGSKGKARTGNAASLSNSTAAMNEVKPEQHFECNIPALLQSLLSADNDDNHNISSLLLDTSTLRIHSLHSPRFRPRAIICGTNTGIAVLELTDPISDSNAGSHQIVVESTRRSGMSVFFVEGNHVYKATLDAKRGVSSSGVMGVKSTNDLLKIRQNRGRNGRTPGATTSITNALNPAGLLEPVLVYKSIPPSQTLSSSSGGNNSNTASSLHSYNSYNNGCSITIPPKEVRLPPKLLLSPSKKYVCLFWTLERRYEILHIRSLARPKLHHDGSKIFPPPVEISGVGGGEHNDNVLGFAWVGNSYGGGEENNNNCNNDSFAVLRKRRPRQLQRGAVKSLDMPQPVSSILPLPGIESYLADIAGGNSGGKRGLQVDTVSSSLLSAAQATATMQLPILQPLRTPPPPPNSNNNNTNNYIELRALIGINTDNAAEISSSRAAATAISLGELALRGQNYHPTALYGGPVCLCVAGYSMPQEGNGNDDTAQQQQQVSLSMLQEKGSCYFYAPRQSTETSTAATSLNKDSASSIKSNNSSFNTNNSSSTKNPIVRAHDYFAVGPVLPYVEFVDWSDDGRFCAVCIDQKRIAIYSFTTRRKSSSNDNNREHTNLFCLIGTVMLSPREDIDAKVMSAKFLHGVLYCTSRTCVQIAFLPFMGNELGENDQYGNDLDTNDNDEKINDEKDDDDVLMISSQMDTHILTSPILTITRNNATSSFTPPSEPNALNHPTILTYSAGSLLVSTANGLRPINLNHPLLRMGILLSSHQESRAVRWIHSFLPRYHEALARFLERRGYAHLVVNGCIVNTSNNGNSSSNNASDYQGGSMIHLQGLSLETIVDMCITWELTESLEQLIDTHGLERIQELDTDDNEGQQYGTLACIGTYLLSKGRLEFVRRLVSECLRNLSSSGYSTHATKHISSPKNDNKNISNNINYIENGDVARRDAFILISLLRLVDDDNNASMEANRLMKRAVRGSNSSNNSCSPRVSSASTTRKKLDQQQDYDTNDDKEHNLLKEKSDENDESNDESESNKNGIWPVGKYIQDCFQ